MRITGHTDFVGEPKTNYSFGLRRAYSLRDILLKKGLQKARSFVNLTATQNQSQQTTLLTVDILTAGRRFESANNHSLTNTLRASSAHKQPLIINSQHTIMYEQNVTLGPGTGTFTQHTFEILIMLLSIPAWLVAWLGIMGKIQTTNR